MAQNHPKQMEGLGNYQIEGYLEQLNEKRIELKRKSDEIKMVIAKRSADLKKIEEDLMARQTELQTVTRKSHHQ